MAPTLYTLKDGQVKVKVHARDHNPPHVHVEGPGDAEAVFSLNPIRLVRSSGFSSQDVALLEVYLEQRQTQLLEKWEEYHG